MEITKVTSVEEYVSVVHGWIDACCQLISKPVYPIHNGTKRGVAVYMHPGGTLHTVVLEVE
jgi:hypothetical protein